MFSLKADDIYHVAEPLHFFSKIIGLSCFTVARKNGKFIVRRSLLNFVCILVTTLYSSATGIFFISHIQEMSATSPFAASNFFVKGMFCAMLGVFYVANQSNWWIFFGRKSLCRILNLLAEVDEELETMKVPMNLRKHKKVVLGFVVAIKAFIFVNVILVYLAEVVDNISHIAVPAFVMFTAFVLMEIGVFTIFQFIFVMWAVKLRYQKINLFLEENFLNSNCEAKDGKDKIMRAATLHDKLVDVSEAINRCFGVPVSSITF